MGKSKGKRKARKDPEHHLPRGGSRGAAKRRSTEAARAALKAKRDAEMQEQQQEQQQEQYLAYVNKLARRSGQLVTEREVRVVIKSKKHGQDALVSLCIT